MRHDGRSIQLQLDRAAVGSADHLVDGARHRRERTRQQTRLTLSATGALYDSVQVDATLLAGHGARRRGQQCFRAPRPFQSSASVVLSAPSGQLELRQHRHFVLRSHRSLPVRPGRAASPAAPRLGIPGLGALSDAQPGFDRAEADARHRGRAAIRGCRSSHRRSRTSPMPALRHASSMQLESALPCPRSSAAPSRLRSPSVASRTAVDSDGRAGSFGLPQRAAKSFASPMRRAEATRLRARPTKSSPTSPSVSLRASR